MSLNRYNENHLTKLNYESLRFIISHGKIQNFFSLQSIQTLRFPNPIFIHYMFDVSFSFFPQLSFHCINQRKLSSLTNHQSSEYLLQQLEKSKRKRIKLTRRTNRRTNSEGERNWLNINKSLVSWEAHNETILVTESELVESTSDLDGRFRSCKWRALFTFRRFHNNPSCNVLTN